MAINISSLRYQVHLMTRTGAPYQLDNVLLNLQWEEQINELSQRASITVANCKVGDKHLIDIANLNCPIFIFAETGNQPEKVFDGTIWEWQYISATQKELMLTCYDPFIRLQQSKDFFYFAPNMDTKNIISKICGEWGITLSYEWGRSITHEKKTFSGNTLSDMIISLLEEVRQKTGEKYIAYYRDGNTLVVKGYGTNKNVYRFDFENTIQTFDKFTLNNLVTQVKIIGKEDKSGRAPIVDIIKGDQQYGVLQEIIRRDANKKLAAVRDEANTIIKERGRPEETIQVDVPDLPFLRKGDLVEMCAGNLLGYFYTEGVTHNATERKMKLTLSRKASRE